jgi:hypothetical protein
LPLATLREASHGSAQGNAISQLHSSGQEVGMTSLDEDNGSEQASILRFLSELASQQHLLERAIEGCDAWFQDEESGLIAGWSSQELIKEFSEHSLTFQHRWGWVYLCTELRLQDSSGQEVGSYRLITTLDGETNDDYLVFDIEKEA